MMAGILVFVEQRDGEIRKASLQAVSEAKRQGLPVAAVIAGSGIAGSAGSIGAYGAEKVFCADDANLAHYSAEGYAEVVVKAVELFSPSAVFFSATAMGTDLAPRVAARLDVGAIADVVGLERDGDVFVARRPVYSGKAFATVDSAGSSPQVISLRPNVFAAEESGGDAEVVGPGRTGAIDPCHGHRTGRRRGGELDVAEADIIVSGGRGIKGPENFALIKQLADAVGGAVGASRAVWTPAGSPTSTRWARPARS
jgi:electron transfer flavoprotein alpha subunit